MSLELSLLLLFVCGAAMGLFGGRLLRGRFGSSTAPRNEGKKLTSAQRRQLRQLKTQLDSGLLTKKEYAAKRKDILNDL